jgi:hypothetical protein
MRRQLSIANGKQYAPNVRLKAYKIVPWPPKSPKKWADTDFDKYQKAIEESDWFQRSRIWKANERHRQKGEQPGSRPSLGTRGQITTAPESKFGPQFKQSEHTDKLM